MREVSDDFMACWSLLKARSTGEGFLAGCRNRILFRYDVMYHYERYIPKIVAPVGGNPLLILNYQELRSSPATFFQKIADFLELEVDDFSAPKEVNVSNDVANNLRNRLRQGFLRFVARNTLGLRRVLGLVRYNVKRSKNNKPAAALPPLLEKQIDALTRELSDTYEHLNTLFDDSPIISNGRL